MQRTGKNACSFFLLLTKKVKNTKKCILKACCRPVVSFFFPAKSGILNTKQATKAKKGKEKNE
jgi:hypothetical protein